MTLPVVKAHAVTVTRAETFIVIDDKGKVTLGTIAAGDAPYAGTPYKGKQWTGPSIVETLEAFEKPAPANSSGSGSGSGPGSGSNATNRHGSPGDDLDGDDATIGFLQVGDSVVMRARVTGAGPIDTLVLADARGSAANLIELVGGFKNRRTGIAVAAADGLARLDLLMIDRWAPTSAVEISINATEARIGPNYDALKTAAKLPIANLGAELGKLVDEAKGKPTFVVLHVADEVSVDLLVTTLGMFVDKGVTEIDVPGPESYQPIFGDLTDAAGGGSGTTTFGKKSGSATPIIATTMKSFEVNGDDIDKEIVRRYMRRFARHVRTCYEQRLLAKPSLAGTVRVKLVILAATGLAEKVTAGGLDPEVDICVRDAFRKVAFPKPHSGGALVVDATYSATPPTAAAKP